jgi:hypothetical protein
MFFENTVIDVVRSRRFLQNPSFGEMGEGQMGTSKCWEGKSVVFAAVGFQQRENRRRTVGGRPPQSSRTYPMAMWNVGLLALWDEWRLGR